MKKCIATVLFFASFSVAIAQSNSFVQSFWPLLFSNLQAPTAEVRSSSDLTRTQNNNKCNDPAEIAYCKKRAREDGNAGNTCSGIYKSRGVLVYTDGNPPRCGGVRVGHINDDKNSCRPLGCPVVKDPPSASQPQPIPKPPGPNCEWMNRELSALRERLKGLPDNDYFRGVRGEEKIKILENSLKKHCPEPKQECSYFHRECFRSNSTSNNGCPWDYPKCITFGSNNIGVCGTLACGSGKCLSSSSRISTPIGTVSVTNLKVGDIVWTMDAAGKRAVRPLVKVLRVLAPNHRVVNLVLADGRTLDVSALHPTADGRTVGDLQAGDAYDSSIVKSADLKPYEGTATYDILPAGDTGFYWANGILMGSTLK